MPLHGDGRVHLGYGRLPDEVVQPSAACGDYRPDCPEELYFAAIQFLPRLEIAFRMTRHVTSLPQSTGDRSLDLVFRVADETRWTPAVAVGARDVAGTRKHHAAFVVGQKSWTAGPLRADLSIGAAFRVVDAGYRELRNGVFGGIRASVAAGMDLLAEYDTRFWNFGVRLAPVRWLWAQTFLMDRRYPGFSAGLALDIGARRAGKAR